MYYPQPQKDPGGCRETIVITRIVFGILLIPILIIFGAVMLVILTFVALSVSPFLALGVILTGAGILVGAAKWESRRIAKEQPRED